MALGFIKKIFTFGKDTAPEQKPEAEAAVAAPQVEEAAPEQVVEDAVAAEERDALLEEAEAANPEAASHVPDEPEPDIYPLPHAPALPVAEDPVAPAEMETAAGPADDISDDEDAVAEQEPVAAVEAVVEDEPEAVVEIEDAIAPTDETTPAEIEDPVLEEVARLEPKALPKGFASAEDKPAEVVVAPQPKRTWFQRLREGLSRTSSQLTGQITSLFTKRKLDDDTLQDLEDLLIQADLGVETALRITDTLASERYGKDVTGTDVSRIMASEITKVLSPVAKPLALDLNHKPHVILVVGVNGTGKTTTIGKLAAKLSGAGLKVMMAAGDTFRAAAIEQLKIWAERTGSEIVSSKLGADAAGLAYEAYERAREKKSDVLIIDTAGRLQNKTELMAELEKIVRVLGKLDPDAPHTVLQTLDATTGQNAMNQVEIFRNVAGVTGLIMTKLDGTARGGILVAIAAKHKLPVYFIGVGEGIDDLEPFEAKDFAEAIAGVGA
nr:signal recognition particle-docking protein FtsY [uncultured Shinella sp.]